MINKLIQTLRFSTVCHHAGVMVVFALIAAGGSPSAAADKTVSDSAISDSDRAQQFAEFFDKVCYSALPDFAPILRLAKEKAWTPITGTALKAYAPEEPADQLKAWSLTHGGTTFRVSISASPIGDTLKNVLPDFARGRAYACSLILPNLVPQSDMGKALQKLVGRTPDEGYEQGPFKVSLWSGLTDELAALMYHYKPKTGAPGGLISFVVLKK